MKVGQKHTRYPKGKKTVGDIIDHIAESFSQEADVNGLFILEEALEKAKELNSFEDRISESEAIYMVHKIEQFNRSNTRKQF